ncbi:hypothetical protein GmRootV15_13370 [Variovorax sp. V15]
MIQMPPADTAGTAGIGPMVGETTKASMAAMATFTWRGTQGSPKTGAVLTSASMRTKGQRKATIQPSSWAEVTETIDGVTSKAGRQASSCGMPENSARM